MRKEESKQGGRLEGNEGKDREDGKERMGSEILLKTEVKCGSRESDSRAKRNAGGNRPD